MNRAKASNVAKVHLPTNVKAIKGTSLKTCDIRNLFRDKAA